ncbi:GNAT family N-acetyltransferase [Wukongibacter baidiensis]|uniref:GNAT family N-acetyltransferase n=1 Tax=Wukongibacter baidiensis TaxID=1723361 RepID=UPI003D7FFB84
MDIIIRSVKTSDASDFNEMRVQDGVRENTLGIITETVMKSENFLKNIDSDTHMLVAEADGKVVGIVGLNIMKNPRMRHSASLGISVRKEYQGQGIGRKLMEKILDVADNWLMIIRIELGVLEDNENAMKLYKSFGFEVEGKKKYAIARNGVYVDEYLMARYTIPQQFK